MLFVISFLLVFLSSYFIASSLTSKPYEHFAYLLLTAFAQIVLFFEVLSLFSAINVQNVLIFNFVSFFACLIFWFKKGRIIFYPKAYNFLRKYKNICKLDKNFIVLGFCFFILILGALFLNLIVPLANADASDYHVARSVFYLINGSLNHFDAADIRILVFPFNSEILYAWILLLLKKEAFLGFFSFFAYFLSMASVYKMMRILKFSLRKILWTIFVLSSCASILVQISGTETDVFVSSLILSSIVLFWISFKENKLVNLFFASLAYALAVGTKTPSVIAIPVIAIIMLFISHKYKNYKNFAIFSLFFIFNFFVFASYIYIINFLDYGNIVGTKSSIVVHKNFYGLKGMVASFIKHLFLFIDFSGFRWGEYSIGKYILAVKLFLLKIFGVSKIPNGLYNLPNSSYSFNGTLIEPQMSFGLLGFLIIFPCYIYSLIKVFFTKNFRVKFVAVLSVSFFLFLAILSYLLVFMNFNGRFMAMFVIITAPVIAYSYFKKNNLLKVIFVLCMFYYMVLVSSHLWARPWWHFLKKMAYEHYTVSDIRAQIKCSNIFREKGEFIDPFCLFWIKVLNEDGFAGKKILYFPNSPTNNMIPVMNTFLNKAKVDIGLISKIDKYDLEDYDYLIFYGKSQYATSFPEKDLKILYSLVDKNIRLLGENSFYCFYYNRKNLIKNSAIDFSDLKNFPFGSECIFKPGYLASRNFKYITLYEFKNKDEDGKTSFYVYENMKNKTP